MSDNQVVTPTLELKRGMYGDYHLFIVWGLTFSSHDPALCPECIRPGSLNRVNDLVSVDPSTISGTANPSKPQSKENT